MECKTYYKGQVIEMKGCSYPKVVHDSIISDLYPPPNVIAISNIFNPVYKLIKKEEHLLSFI